MLCFRLTNPISASTVRKKNVRCDSQLVNIPSFCTHVKGQSTQEVKCHSKGSVTFILTLFHEYNLT